MDHPQSRKFQLSERLTDSNDSNESNEHIDMNDFTIILS